MLNLLFDLDGTLTNPRLGITRSIAHALEAMGVDVPPASELERLIGPPLRDGFATILGTDGPLERAVALFRERYGDTGLFENEPYDGVEDMLRTMRARSSAMYVVTSKPQVFAERIVDRFGLAAHFDGIYGCELSGERSAKAELIGYVLDREQLRAEDCVMVGDREHDVVAAHAHGVFCVGVTWGFGSEEELRNAGADAICSTTSELLDWYGRASAMSLDRA